MNVQSESGVSNCRLLIERDVDVPMRDGARLKARRVSPGRVGPISGHSQSRSVPEGQALDSAGQSGGKAQSPHELGDGQSGMVGAEGLCLRARRRPWQRQVARPVRAVVARRGDRLLRCHRMGGGASPGATARSGSTASPTTPSTSGSSPTCSRRRSMRSFPGKASPISTATRCSTAAFSASS